MQNEIYKWLDELQGEHWWLRARNEVVLSLFQSHLNDGSDCLEILEVGCGPGGLLDSLSQYGKVWGMDNYEAIQYARNRYSEKYLVEGYLPDKVPFPGKSFDRVIMLDVLEHIDDDVAALRSIHFLLRPGGIVYITVPALMLLWSRHDELAMHKRRYKKTGLTSKVKSGGFEVIICSYINMGLFIPIFIAKMINKITRQSIENTRLPIHLEELFYRIFKKEKYLLKRSLLPIGISILCAAKRSDGLY